MSSVTSTSSQSSMPISSTSHQVKSNSRDKEIQSLIKQKSNLNEQIEAVRSNENLDKKLKQERVQALKASIQEVDAQIAQIKAEQMQEKMESSKPKQTQAKKAESDTYTDINPESMHALIKNSTTYDRMGKLVNLSKQLEGEIKPIQSEIKMERDRLANNPTNDIGRPLMLENAERIIFQAKREEILDMKSTIRRIDSKIGDLVTELKDNSKAAAKDSIIPSSPSRTEDKEETNETNKSTKSGDKSSTVEAAGSGGAGPVTGSAPASASLDIWV